MTNAGSAIRLWIAEIDALTLGWHPPISDSKFADLNDNFQTSRIVYFPSHPILSSLHLDQLTGFNLPTSYPWAELYFLMLALCSPSRLSRGNRGCLILSDRKSLWIRNDDAWNRGYRMYLLYEAYALSCVSSIWDVRFIACRSSI
jgi:hypothetical protein